MNQDFMYGFLIGILSTLGLVSIGVVLKLTHFKLVTAPKLQKKYKKENK